MTQKDLPRSSMFSRAKTRNIHSLKGDSDVYVKSKSYKICGHQRPLVCSLKTISIRTNLFDSKGISCDFINDVKMMSKRSLVRYS